MPIAQKQATTAWPDGSTWAFFGTVAEDATGGTHVCSLTVTPGAGNEFEVIFGDIINGNTATAQIMGAFIDDGTNRLMRYMQISDTAALIERVFPLPSAPTTNVNNWTLGASQPIIVSGTMRLVLQVSTTAVSVTQTFGLVCRLRSPKKPTATLADTVGTPTLTTNTNAIFG